MQFDSVRRHTSLPVKKIKHAHASDLDRDVGGLEARGGGESGVEFVARIGNARQEWTTCANTGGRGDFRDHSKSAGILKDQVIVRIAFQFELCQCGVDDPLRCFQGRHTIVRWDRIGGSRRSHGRDGCVAGRIQVNQADIGISSGFN